MKAEQPRTVDILLSALEGDASPRMTIGELIDSLGDRAFGVLILLCALPNCVPAPPGLSTITGAPIVVFAIQLILGSRHPWLPAFLRNRSLSRQDLRNLVGKAEPYIRKLERLSRPRLSVLVDGPAERLAGLVILLLSVILVLPVPLGNLFPAVAIALIAVALMEQDGIAILVGYVAAVASSALAFAVIVIVIEFFVHLTERLLG